MLLKQHLGIVGGHRSLWIAEQKSQYASERLGSGRPMKALAGFVLNEDKELEEQFRYCGYALSCWHLLPTEASLMYSKSRRP